MKQFKKKCTDYSPLFPMLKKKFNDNGKEIPMTQAIALNKITREQARGEELLLF